MIERIAVTQKHIDEGQQGKCFTCAVALALREHYPQAQVGETWLHLSSEFGDTFRIDHPLGSWIDNFDDGGKSKPFTLVLYRHSNVASLEAAK